MIFTNPQQIFDIINNNPNRDMIIISRKIADSLRKYVTGEGLIESMEHLPFFEKSDVFDIKKKITKTTKDLIDRLLQPIDKVFNAKGGVKILNTSASNDEPLTEYLKVIRRGLSVTEWIESVALKAYLIDPMGLMLTETDADGKAYPTYKSTGCIYDYELNGRQPEYVIFELEADDIKQLISLGILTTDDSKKQVFRVIDDAREYYITKSNYTLTVIDFIEHNFTKVPALIVSDIPVYDSPLYESPLQPVSELIATYFRDNTDLQLYKKYQAHPREWSIELTCPKCEGTKVHDGEDCNYCDGTGIKAHIKPSERISVAIQGDGKALAPTPPGGFYTAPIEAADFMVNQLEANKEELDVTFWGGSLERKSDGKRDIANTATEILIGERAKEPKLRKFSKWAQRIESHIVDTVKQAMLQDDSPSVILYGEIYIHGTIEQLTEYYQTLVQKQAPVTLLDATLIDVYESKYSEYPMALLNAKKLMQVEPFVHNSIAQVVSWNIPDDIKAMKVYYGEWVKTKNQNDILRGTVEALKAELNTYAMSKGMAVPEPANGMAT